jgi:hypothetical protein
MVTEAEHRLIDLNTAPRLLTDRKGELAFKIRWLYVEYIAAYGQYIGGC